MADDGYFYVFSGHVKADTLDQIEALQREIVALVEGFCWSKQLDDWTVGGDIQPTHDGDDDLPPLDAAFESGPYLDEWENPRQ